VIAVVKQMFAFAAAMAWAGMAVDKLMSGHPALAAMFAVGSLAALIDYAVQRSARGA
jgi:hypothetical protein